MSSVVHKRRAPALPEPDQAVLGGESELLTFVAQDGIAPAPTADYTSLLPWILNHAATVYTRIQ